MLFDEGDDDADSYSSDDINGVGDDDDHLAGAQFVLAVVAFYERGAVADEVLDEAGGGVVNGRDAHEAAGAADDFAGDDLAVAGAERVDHLAAGDGGAEDRRERGNGRGIVLPGGRKERETAVVIGGGQRGQGHGRGNEGRNAEGQDGFLFRGRVSTAC